ncbi:MAG: cation-translocating P-type ATPase, partial [Planctomycetes bacterium]|nr:cation-translocating P-type ATPase [Planctomycetota bacterium]
GGSGIFLATAWTLSLTGGPQPLQHLFTLLAFAVAGVPAIQTVWGKIRTGRIDVDLLMLLGAGLAAYIGSPFEGALLLFLFAFSGGLENLALRRTQSAITSLRHLAPNEATLIEGKSTRRISIRQIAIGAAILVRPGDKVPLDGVVVDGSSSVDESAITGESIPRDCKPGDTVFAGTQNLNGRLEVRVTKLSGDTTLAKIVELVTQAKQHPARAQRLIDRIGPIYSIIVMAGAAGTALVAWLVGLSGDVAMLRGIALLIVASPCALIIATPVAYLSAIAAAARRGVLIKGGAHLESIARAKVFAFDKTGTLTTGEIRLTDIVATDAIEETTALELAGAISASSTHPLATAVNAALQERGLTAPAVSEYESTPGEGAGGVIEGRTVWLGRPELVAQRASTETADRVVRQARRLREQGKTVSAVVVDGAAILLGFQDTIREGSARCIELLRRQGVTRIEMLTGDHEIVARKVTTSLRLDGFLAELVPQAKVAGVEMLRAKHGPVVLIGDGINDAPALAHADTGIAMGAMGAQIALDAADVVLMKDRIEVVAWLQNHARRTAGIVRQNLTLAIGVIAILSVFAVMGYIPLPLAVIGHEGSTVVVALNALRLLRSSE